ncbi:hypothetical protein [Streptomyces sp. NPDC001139]
MYPEPIRDIPIDDLATVLTDPDADERLLSEDPTAEKTSVLFVYSQ